MKRFIGNQTTTNRASRPILTRVLGHVLALALLLAGSVATAGLPPHDPDLVRKEGVEDANPWGPYRVEVEEIFWALPGGGKAVATASSCHPSEATRRAQAAKEAKKRAMQNLELECADWWEDQNSDPYGFNCADECSDEGTYRELLPEFNFFGVGIVEVIAAEQTSEIFVRSREYSGGRGCMYSKATAEEACGCRCEAKLKYLDY